MANRKRNSMLRIRVTEAELERFDREYIKTNYKSRADFLLALLNNNPVVVIEDLVPVLVELRRQGNNINQIAHKLNAVGDVNSEPMRELIKRWYEAFTKLSDLTLEMKNNAFVQRKKQ